MQRNYFGEKYQMSKVTKFEPHICYFQFESFNKNVVSDMLTHWLFNGYTGRVWGNIKQCLRGQSYKPPNYKLS